MRLAAGLLAFCLGPAFAAGDAERGRQIVANRQVGLCLLCHAAPIPEERFQGDLAPDLEGVGSRLTQAQIRQRIVDPSKDNPHQCAQKNSSTGDPFIAADTHRRKSAGRRSRRRCAASWARRR